MNPTCHDKLEEAEAKRLETSIKRVTKHYSIPMQQKHLDLSMLVVTMTEIYGTRAVAIYTNRKSAPKQPAPENVLNFGIPNVGT